MLAVTHGMFIEVARAVCAEEHKRVRDLDGLRVIGTERHESRRIDDQLRGRAGKQGNPGSSRFYLSLKDDLLRLFGGSWARRLAKVLSEGERDPQGAGSVGDVAVLLQRPTPPSSA